MVRKARLLLILVMVGLVLVLVGFTAVTASTYTQYLPIISGGGGDASSGALSETPTPFASATIPPMPTGATCPGWIYLVTPANPEWGYCATATPNPYP